MFGRIRQYYKQRQEKKINQIASENEVFGKILDLLKDTRRWVNAHDILYYHLDSKFVIEWGEKSGYECSVKIYSVRQPEQLEIPSRFLQQFDELITEIDNYNQGSPLQFLNQYLDGEYKVFNKVNNKDFEQSLVSEARLWLRDNAITEFYIVKNDFWFKNESDALAFKLWGA